MGESLNWEKPKRKPKLINVMAQTGGCLNDILINVMAFGNREK